MKPVNPGVKLTYDDYVHFPEDGLRHELIDGEHFVTPTPIRKHQAICGNLLGLIWSHLREQPAGRVFTAPFDVILSNFDVVEPDLLFLTNERMAEVATAPWVKGAPSLVVEIGSSGTRKRDATLHTHRSADTRSKGRAADPAASRFDSATFNHLRGLSPCDGS